MATYSDWDQRQLDSTGWDAFDRAMARSEQMSMPRPDPARYDGSRPEPPYPTPHADHRLRLAAAPAAVVSANLTEAWVGLRLLRDTIEEVGPAGCIRSAEYVACHPVCGHFLDEATELARGIQTIAALWQAAIEERA